MLKICKNYKTCIYSCSCIYAKPTDKQLNTDSYCYDYIKEEYYNQYARKIKLEKLKKYCE